MSAKAHPSTFILKGPEDKERLIPAEKMSLVPISVPLLARGENDYLAWVIGMSQSETDRRTKSMVHDESKGISSIISSRMI